MPDLLVPNFLIMVNVSATRNTMCDVEEVSSAPLTRVELHSHLDGSVRATTVWELAKAKGFPLPGDGSLRTLLVGSLFEFRISIDATPMRHSPSIS